MTLRIREIVIRADISDDAPSSGGHNGTDIAPEAETAAESGAMTRRFYEEDYTKDNER